MKNYKAAFAIAIVWLLMVTFLLCIPGTKLPKFNWQNRIWLDKWVHIALFLMLVLLWCRIYFTKNQSFIVKRTFIIITIVSIIYGISMEIIQHYFIPFRSFDVGDIIADAIGAVAGYFIAIRQIKFIRREEFNR